MGEDYGGIWERAGLRDQEILVPCVHCVHSSPMHFIPNSIGQHTSFDFLASNLDSVICLTFPLRKVLQHCTRAFVSVWGTKT
jgi:hypothetical protein